MVKKVSIFPVQLIFTKLPIPFYCDVMPDQDYPTFILKRCPKLKTISTFFNLFSQPEFFIHDQAGKNTAAGFELEEEPLRSELYSITQMDQYGKYLGRTHVLSDMHEKDRLLARLADNETVIRRVYDILASAVRSENRITPAAEWLLDNFYLIEEQIQIAKNHLPEKYSSELPRLSNGTMGSVPRVYELALEVVSHGGRPYRGQQSFPFHFFLPE